MSHHPEPLAHISSLTPYVPGLPIESLVQKSGLLAKNISKLASNENPYGISPSARVVLRRAATDAHLYPDGHALQAALAVHYGLSPDNVVLGNGSNDVLDLIARVFLGPGTAAVSSEYAFAIYAIATHTAGARNVITPATPGLGHNLAAMSAAVTPATRVVWLANPNNPTGTFIRYPEIKALIESLPPTVIVVLDEAYYEYLPPELQINTTKWLAAHPNLIIVRTFSKIYGLAGLRIGYGLASPRVAELLNRIRQPFNTNSVALAAALAALADQAFVQLSQERNRRGLRQLSRGLSRLGIGFVPSMGNFVAAHIPDAHAVYEALLAHGIITRPLAPYGLADYLRISVGKPAENTRLLQALRLIRPQNQG